MSSPSSAGRLRSLLLDRSRLRRLTNLEMSGGILERQLSFRYNDVRCVRCHKFGLKFLIVPEEQKIITWETFFKLHILTSIIIMLHLFLQCEQPCVFLYAEEIIILGNEIIHQHHQYNNNNNNNNNNKECYWKCHETSTPQKIMQAALRLVHTAETHVTKVNCFLVAWKR
jgi:hypothetical protein